MALPPEAHFTAIFTFYTHRRKAHLMADASVHGDTRNAVIPCDIRNREKGEKGTGYFFEVRHGLQLPTITKK